MVSENTMKVLDFLKEHAGETITNDDIAFALGLSPRATVPMVNYWASARGGNVVMRSEPEEITDSNGNVKKIRYITYVG